MNISQTNLFSPFSHAGVVSIHPQMIHTVCTEHAKSGTQLLTSHESHILMSFSNNRYRTEVLANTIKE